MKSYVFVFLKGLAMGAANVIPGVSGGTIALITGIYEKLINSLKAIDLEVIKMVFTGKIKQAWEHVNATFLVLLFAGVGVSLVSLAKLFKFFLEHENPAYEIGLMAFFFGLILASLFSVGKTVEKWNPVVILSFIIGVAAAVGIALLTPASENGNWWYLIICGIVGMCSMILPGLSGSFVLIIMGNYKLIMLDAVSEFNLKVLMPVMIGVVVGMVALSRVLSWIFKHYRDITISLMTGFILGSLLIIWPWKNELYYTDAAGEFILKKGEKLVSGYDWYMPDFGTNATWVAILMAVLGAASIWGTEYFAAKLGGKEEV
ncbi:MAG: DUF368 domain-containing protein [Bacteroidia bacterium]|nr:DUF368 domain-containing protein [Bacteroidia bacterium]